MVYHIINVILPVLSYNVN